jgi:RNA polymerase sigma factor (sigma-70 family)
MTADLIAQSQTGSNDATLALIEKFNPLLKKYTYKLFYDDAYSDLLVDFIELLHNIKLGHLHDKSEGSLVSYICTSVRSSYIRRSIAINKLHNLMPYSDLNDNELYCIEAASAVSDTYFKYELPGVDQVLTKSESSIIKMIYLSGYTIKETACIFGITRQAVNQMKKRALKKLENLYSDKLYCQKVTI